MPDTEADGSSIPYRVGLLETTVIRHSSEIADLKEWRAELRGAMALVKFTLGTSVLTGIVAVVSLVVMMSQLSGAG